MGLLRGLPSFYSGPAPRNAIVPDGLTAGRGRAQVIEGSSLRRPRRGRRRRLRDGHSTGTPCWLRHGGASSAEHLPGIRIGGFKSWIRRRQKQIRLKNGKRVSHKRSHGHHHTTPISQPHPGGSLGSLCPSRKPRLHLAFPLQLCPVSCCSFLMEKEAQHHETRQGPKAHVEMHSTELLASIFARCAPVSSSPGPDRCPRPDTPHPDAPYPNHCQVCLRRGARGRGTICGQQIGPDRGRRAVTRWEGVLAAKDTPRLGTLLGSGSARASVSQWKATHTHHQ